jgi:hypothetical protein
LSGPDGLPIANAIGSACCPVIGSIIKKAINCMAESSDKANKYHTSNYLEALDYYINKCHHIQDI